MYTNEDLKFAVDKKIFTQNNVDDFKKEISIKKNITPVDEENFKLIGSLNDIFVVIASSLLMFSIFWFTGGDIFSYILFSALAWGLSELFVRQKKMALPGIVLLIYFVGGITVMVGDELRGDYDIVFSFLAGLIASVLHWKRFHVPITIAVGVGTFVGFLISFLFAVFDLNFFEADKYLWVFTLLSGVSVFLFAMYWDSADKKRETYKSDVAFWLHLLAAPLIVHSLFSQIIDFGYGSENNSFMIVIALCVYILLTSLSLAVNRRVFMISSLIYVLFALASLLDQYGSIDSYESLAGVLMGALLLGVSVYWHEAREKILTILPRKILDYVPSGDSRV